MTEEEFRTGQSVDEQVATEATPPAEAPNVAAVEHVASVSESAPINDAGAAVEAPKPEADAAPVIAIVEAAPAVEAADAGPVCSHVLSHLEDEAVALFGDAEAYVKRIIAWVASKL